MNSSTLIIDIISKNFGQSIASKAGKRLEADFYSILSSPLLIIFIIVMALTLFSSISLARTSKSKPQAKSKPLEEIFTQDEENPVEENTKTPEDENLDLWSEKSTEKPLSVSAPNESLIASMFKASISLVIVLSIIIAIAYFIKKYRLKGNLFGGKHIHILDTCYLGPKKSLALVKIEHQILLLGLTNQQILFLTQINTGDTATASSDLQGFAEQLSENSSKLSPNPAKASATAIASLLEDRFRGLKKI